MKLWILLFPILAFANLQPLLDQAEALSTQYNVEIAKLPPPSLKPQTTACLNSASIWFTIDLDKIACPALQTLADENLWELLREIGAQGLFLKGLKLGFGLDPKWGSDWEKLWMILKRKQMTLIGSSIGNSTGLSPDFFLALRNDKDYAGLYHLIEIEPKDWKLLPTVPTNDFAANVPWLKLQKLHKKGYVPQKFNPYTKASSWNATAEVKGSDGQMRRWIYLKQNQLDPVIDWLSPSFAGYRIASADLIASLYRFGQKIIQIEDTSASEMLILWARKLGLFSTLNSKEFCNLKKTKSDLFIDHFTKNALEQAFACEDAQGLRLVYRLFLDEKIDIKRFVHSLFQCEEPLLLAQFYAMQPGVFSFSASDLLGTNQAIDLMVPNEHSLHGSLPSQMSNRCSFARKLRDLLTARNECGIALGKLVDVPNTSQKGLFLLLFRNQYQLQLLAINFAKVEAIQTLEIPEIRDTSAINLLTGLAENKPLDSTMIQIRLSPLSMKSILFQQKYY